MDYHDRTVPESAAVSTLRKCERASPYTFEGMVCPLTLVLPIFSVMKVPSA